MSASFHRGSSVLLTGVTGLIGGEILRGLSARGHEGRVWALIRPKADEDPDERLLKRLARSGVSAPLGCPVSAVAGDVLLPDWGLSTDDRSEIADRVDIILHNAADTSFAAHRATSRTNVGSVQQLITFARSFRRTPLIVYMSTASNVGRVTHTCLREDDGCRPENEHFNEYTQSKAVAERLLIESGLPILILRPTIVLGAGLPDPLFARQILWCAPLARAFRALPIDPNARLDIVDAGFVAEATLRLLETPRRTHGCYHLSAGTEGCVTVGRLAELVGQVYGRRTTLELIPPAEWTHNAQRVFVRSAIQRRVFRSLRHYLPFLNMDVVFDNARLAATLSLAPVNPRPIVQYLPALLRLIRPKAALKEAALP